MSGDKEEEIAGIILVTCIVCERIPTKIPFLAIKDAYPIIWVTYAPAQTALGMGMKPTKMQAYLCSEHFQKYS